MASKIAEPVRRFVYESFATTGRAPSRKAIQGACSLNSAEVEDTLKVLATDRHLVLDRSGKIVMAHPFTSMNLGFSVMGQRTLWWGGCAWDSFAIPHLVEDERRVLVATTCPACDTPLAWHVSHDEPPNGPELAHFLVPMHDCWSDVVFTCSNQRIFCDDACIEEWLSRSGETPGYVMDLGVLWNLASDWYTGRLDSPYERRDPQAAADYFRSVGLHGPFWGLSG